jgi:hypothetical protein
LSPVRWPLVGWAFVRGGGMSGTLSQEGPPSSLDRKVDGVGGESG